MFYSKSMTTGEVEPVSHNVRNLRISMDALREQQTTAGIIIDSARFDAATSDLNKNFLARFLKLIPVQWPSSNTDRLENQRDIRVKDAGDVRATASLGLTYNATDDRTNHENRFTFIIGDRTIPDNPARTELLLLYGEHRGDRLPMSFVDLIHVPTSHWQQHQTTRTSALHVPPSSELLAEMFNHKTSTFDIPKKHGLRSEELGLVHAKVPSMSPLFMLSERSYEYAMRRNYRPTRIALYPERKIDRGLVSSDFEPYKVMAHLEVIAAAYGIGKALDALKARRAEQMGEHPAQAQYGLDSYQEVMEQASVYEITAPLRPPIL